jgi:FixJ family two-component response regulator
MDTTLGIVFIIDDEEEIRDVLARFLKGLQIPVRTFAGAQAFLDVYRGEPGCLMTDVRMPGMSGIDLQKKLIEHEYHLPVIIMTGHADVPMAIEALKHGAMEFVEKPFRMEALVDRIREALQQDQARRTKDAESSDIAQRCSRLTPKEREIVDQVASGLTNKDIAAQRGVSSQAIDATRNRAMGKLGVKTLAELVQLVMKARSNST